MIEQVICTRISSFSPWHRVYLVCNPIVEELTQFKFIKSQKCFRKTVGNLIFELQFYSDKYNRSSEYIGIECDFRLWCKEYGNKCDVNTIVAVYSYRDDSTWFDITTKKKLSKTYKVLEKDISRTMLSLYDAFVNDYDNAVLQLLNIHFDEYHVHLDFIADTLGKDVIKNKAKAIYSGISEEDLKIYRNKANEHHKLWMISRSNEKYVIDNRLYE